MYLPGGFLLAGLLPLGRIGKLSLATAAGLLLSRGRGDGAVDLALLDQFGRHPAALAAVAGIMVVFAAFPGLPVMPFLLGAAGLGTATTLAWQKQKRTQRCRAQNHQGLKFHVGTPLL